MKLSTVIFLLSWFALGSGCRAQPPDSLWSRTFGGDSVDVVYCVRQTSDGGYILTGWTRSFGAGGYDLWLIKTDANGVSQWTHTYGGSGDDRGTSVVEVSDGYVVTGRTSSFPAGNENVWLLKANLNGDTVWSHVYGGAPAERAYSVRQTTDGGLVVAGNTGTQYGADFWLIRTDANGDSLWTRRYGSAGTGDWCNSAQQTSDGGYVLAGYTLVGPQTDMWVVKTNASGDSVWSRRYDDGEGEACRAIEQTPDGGYILGGDSNGSGNLDMWLVKTNANGDTSWSRRFGGADWDECYGMDRTLDGGYVLAGYRNYGLDQQMWIIKTDASGDSTWGRVMGGPGQEIAYSVQQTTDGGYVIAGFTTSYGLDSTEAWLVRLGTTPQPGIEVTPTTLSFGTVFVGDSTILMLMIRSEGNADLTVSQLSVAGDFYTNFAGPQTLPPGDSLEVTVTFAPVQPGPQIDTIWVQSDAPGSPVWVSLLGTGIVNSAGDPLKAPKNFALSTYPNPFNATTMISYDLPKFGTVSLRVIDVVGREVAILKDGVTEAGSYQVAFDARRLGTGFYFARLEAGKLVQTTKMLLLK